MADGTIKIDVLLNKQQAKSDAEIINSIFSNLGKGAGDSLKNDLKSNLDQAKAKAKETGESMKKDLTVKGKTEIDTKGAENELNKVKEKIREIPKDHKTEIKADGDSAKQEAENIKKRLKAIPDKVKTQLVADAKEAGIANFEQALKKLPPKKRVEILSRVQKGEVIDYEDLLRKLPTKVVTQLKLNDQASPGMRAIQEEAKNTGKRFGSLRDIITGTFAGGLIQAGVQSLISGLRSAAQAGMEYNKQQDTMRTVWKALTTEAPQDGQRLVGFINSLSQHSIYASETVDRMAQSFYHVHSNVGETERWTKAFINLGSTLHMSNDALAEAGEQFAKIVAGGKASAEDMNVMINRFPMFGEALQQATGKSMKQLYDLSARGKLTANDFVGALEFLGKKYKSGTQEAMTSTMGMGMYLKSRWSVLTGEVMKSSFDMSKSTMASIKNLLSDGMLKEYASMASKFISSMIAWISKLLTYIDNHKETIVDIIKNLGEIVGIIGKTVWDTFTTVLKAIGTALGTVHDKGEDANDPLDLLDGILQAIVDHKDDLSDFIKVMMGLFAIKKANDMVTALTSYYSVLKDIIGLGGIGGVVKGIGVGAKGGKLATTAEEMAEGGIEATGATKAGRLIGVGADKLFGIQRGGKEVSEAITKATTGDLTPELIAGGARTATQTAEQTAVRTAEKGIISRTASRIPVIGSLIAGGTELIGINKNNRNEKIGRAIGATGGTAVGGTAGAWIGGAIGSVVAPGAGTAAGAGIGSVIGSTVGGMFGAKGGGSIGKNFANIKKSVGGFFDDLKTTIGKKATTVGKGIAETFGKAIGGISKVFTKIKKPVAKAFEALGKGLQKTAKVIGTIILAPFVLVTAGIIKAWKKIQKPVMKVVSALGKGISKAWNSISKVTSKVWGGMAKIITKVWKGLSKTVSKGVGAVVKVVERAWNGLSKVTGKVWNSIKKVVLTTIQSIWKPLSKILSKIADIVSDSWNSILRTTRRVWNSIFDKISDVLGSIWRAIRSKFDSIKNTISGALDSIRSKWNSVWNGIKKKVSDIWDDIKGIVHGGVKAIGNFWNTGARGLEKVAGFFGAKVSIPKFKNGTPGPIARPMLAMVNDQEGPLHREAIFRRDGKVEIPEGRNVLTMLHPGDAVMPAKETAEMFGIPKFASGFGNWFGKAWNYASSKISKLEDMIDDKIDAITDALKDPLGTLLNIYSRGKNTAKSFWHDFGDSGAKKIPHWALSWFKNLLNKLKDKLDEVGGSGPVSASMIKRAASKMHVDPPASFIHNLMKVIMNESGGRNIVQQIHDVNSGGNEARGILQYTPGTFRAYAMPGHTNIMNPYDQLLAFFNNSDWRNSIGMTTIWGHTKMDWLHSGPQGSRRFANGGWAYEPSIFGEVAGEPEVAINPARSTADSLILQAIKARANKDPQSFSAKIDSIISAGKSLNATMAPVATAPTSSNSSSPILNEHDYTSRLEKIGAKLDALIEKRVVVDGHSFANTYERYGIQQRRKISNYSERGLAMNVRF